jgi:hypothetical protein
MATELQLETAEPELKLLIEWSPRWHSFVSSIRPALSRSERPLAGEISTTIFPVRNLFLAWAAEILFLLAVILLPTKLGMIHPYVPPPHPKWDVIYYSGKELPQTEDAGGAPAGSKGKSGGHEAFHPTQVIKVARGKTVTDQVLDAPKLNLPKTSQPVANLLAIQKVQGPPPSEGMRSSLTLPQMPKIAAVAPPPEISRDDMRRNPTMTASVVPPPAASVPRELPQARFPEMRTEVVPPPVSSPERDTASTARLSMPAPSVVAPPPSLARDVARMAGQVPVRPTQDVVPPPVQANTGTVTGRTVPSMANASAVPPPPTLSNTQSAGRGLGRAGAGAGLPLEAGPPTAPPGSSGGNSPNAAAIISSKPGTTVGAPDAGSRGALAMSPTGGVTPGIGGTGGGSGNTTGAGSGAAHDGGGAGSAKSGTGPGASTTAKVGTSPVPGPGGTGIGSRAGVPNTAGISVQGGSIVTLPSFGTSADNSAVAGRSSVSGHPGPGITVVATSRSGGAFNFYGALKGDRVYTIYLDTTLGMAVLQFADPTTEAQGYAEELNAPEPLRKTLPPSADHTRVVISCVIDRTGNVKNAAVLDGKSSTLAAKILPALANWRFRPVLRGEKPIDVQAILGFNIDTR